ncbi:hypothetical protein NKR23_g12467 [Pleurostoma richardsiae]|uniref:Uncharacterized protein n=1 Tax=Pleurostoma richardsiae TaxID=41990 RepID=A0AA38VFF1_9PEZI|nr:hypothetical protein NKR23_g12467 [Pleurostoma richardsiae]
MQATRMEERVQKTPQSLWHCLESSLFAEGSSFKSVVGADAPTQHSSSSIIFNSSLPDSDTSNSEVRDTCELYGRIFPSQSCGSSWRAIDDEGQAIGELEVIFAINSDLGYWAGRTAAAYDEAYVLNIDTAPHDTVSESNCECEIGDINEE